MSQKANPSTSNSHLCDHVVESMRGTQFLSLRPRHKFKTNIMMLQLRANMTMLLPCSYLWLPLFFENKPSIVHCTHVLQCFYRLLTRLCKKKKVFFKRFNFQKEKVFMTKKGFFWGGKWISFQCHKKAFLLHAYLNKNNKNNNIAQK